MPKTSVGRFFDSQYRSRISSFLLTFHSNRGSLLDPEMAWPYGQYWRW